MIAMDEAAFCYDMLSGMTVDKTGTKTVRMTTTGHEKAMYMYTVVFAAKVDGIKPPPFIVFKGNKRKGHVLWLPFQSKSKELSSLHLLMDG